MKEAKAITAYFIILTVVTWIAYDAWVIMSKGKEASISWVMIEYSYEYPIGVFLLGLLFGHLFWRMKDPRKGNKK